MTRKPDDDKTTGLRRLGCLNPRPERVQQLDFIQQEFFDPKDLVQVKYEMLRRVTAEGETVSRAAEDFGFSRNAFYETKQQFAREGLAGLIPKKRGPKGGHKITEEVLRRLRQALEVEPELDSDQLVELIRQDFGIEVHSRSVERALQRGKKNS